MKRRVKRKANKRVWWRGDEDNGGEKVVERKVKRKMKQEKMR